MEKKKRKITDPKDTIGYNHYSIGKGKPVIANQMFKEALEKIDAGQVDLIDMLFETYGMDSAQKQLLLDRKEKINKA